MLIALLVGVFGLVGYINLKNTTDQVDVITERETPTLDRLSEMKELILNSVRDVFVSQSAEQLNRTEFYENLDRFDATVAEFTESSRSGDFEGDEEAELLDQLVAARLAMASSAQTLFANDGSDGSSLESDISNLEANAAIVIPMIAQFLQVENDEVAEAQRGIQETLTSARRLTIILVLVSIALAVGLGLLLSHSILAPIDRLRGVAERLGKGDLSARAAAGPKDEIGSLADSFNQMATARQSTEEQRVALIQELEEKNAELEKAYAELQTLDRMKDEFISTVSHELRTPLTSIKGAAEILIQYRDEDPDSQMEFLSIIDNESDRLTRLINDVLDLARIESGEVYWEFSPVDLAGVIESAVESVRALSVQKNIDIAITGSQDLPSVNSDHDKLVQVVTNLLSNAVKFTPRGGMIRVQSRLLSEPTSEAGSGMIEVSVSDNGVGVPEGESDNIFGRFQQAGTNITGRPRGSGLGLSISKEIVTRLGGEIWVESQPGSGSTFYFTIPNADAPARSNNGEQQTSSPSAVS